MKLNIESNDYFLNGYKTIVSNISSDVPEGIEVVYADFTNLDPLCKDGTVEEIIFNPPMNVLDRDLIVKCLEHWTTKLVKGGILKISFLDIRQIARAIYLGDISLAEAHCLTIGKNNELRTVSDYESVKNIFKNSSCKINLAKNFKFNIILEIEKK